MRYSLAIADDDATIRRGLSSLIKWDELGFELIGAYADGRELLELLRLRPIDVILSDIRMCSVSGLEVAHAIQERKAATRIVLLSCYQEFDYARDALRFQVTDYLLKPVSIPQIRETFARLYATLEGERMEREKTNVLRIRYQTLSERAEERILQEALAGAFPDAEALARRAAALGLDEEKLNLACCLVSIEPEETVRQNAETPRQAEDQLIEALRCMEDGIRYHVVNQQSDAVRGVLLWDGEGAPPWLTPLYPDILEEKLLLLTARRARVRIIRACATFAEFAVQPVHTSALLPDSERTNGGCTDAVARARTYIRAHFAAELTLGEVARHVYLNPTYLSRIFREQTGESFTEMLARMRMEHATALLREGKATIREIAEECGYGNEKYFYKQFKRHAGMSPGAWRTSEATGRSDGSEE